MNIDTRSPLLHSFRPRYETTLLHVPVLGQRLAASIHVCVWDSGHSEYVWIIKNLSIVAGCTPAPAVIINEFPYSLLALH